MVLVFGVALRHKLQIRVMVIVGDLVNYANLVELREEIIPI